MSDNLEDVLNDMNRQYDVHNNHDAEMEFKSPLADDDEDVVDMNYLLAAGSLEEHENDNASPRMK